MDGGELHDCARARGLELRGTSAGWPFGPAHEVLKVRGKVFLMLTTVLAASTGYGVDDAQRGQPIITLKAEPEDAEALRRQHTSIAPGYHMNKRHWVSVRTGDSIDTRLVRELVTDSYRLVVETLPRRDRPFGWDAPSILL